MQEIDHFLQHLNYSIDHKNAYDEWAATYDEELASVKYQAPYYVALAASKLCSTGVFLDLGCGTGLVGEAIQTMSSGAIIVDGYDSSREMLKIASEKGIYRSLIQGDIFDLPFQTASYDLITAAGVFASTEDRQLAGDPDHQAIPDIVRLIKPGGYFIFTVSSRVWKTAQQDYESVIASSSLNQIERSERPYHHLIPTMMCLVFQRDS